MYNKYFILILTLICILFLIRYNILIDNFINNNNYFTNNNDTELVLVYDDEYCYINKNIANKFITLKIHIDLFGARI